LPWMSIRITVIWLFIGMGNASIFFAVGKNRGATGAEKRGVYGMGIPLRGRLGGLGQRGEQGRAKIESPNGERVALSGERRRRVVEAPK